MVKQTVLNQMLSTNMLHNAISNEWEQTRKDKRSHFKAISENFIVLRTIVDIVMRSRTHIYLLPFWSINYHDKASRFSSPVNHVSMERLGFAAGTDVKKTFAGCGDLSPEFLNLCLDSGTCRSTKSNFHRSSLLSYQTAPFFLSKYLMRSL